MIKEERAKLREAATAALNVTRATRDQRRAALAADWELQTSNSFRRIGAHGDGDVLCATTQASDGHPDLLAKPAVLDYVVAAQPRVVLELLDQLDAAEVLCARVDDLERRIDSAEAKSREAVAAMQELSRQLSPESP